MIGYYAADMRLAHDFPAGNADRVFKAAQRPFMEKANTDADVPDIDALVTGHDPEQAVKC